MSHESYLKWWVVTKKQMEDLTLLDKITRQTKPTKDRNVALRLIGGLYARYSLCVQKMDACLDQLCLVQKNFTIRKLMDAATVRLRELKEELVKLDMSEYHYIDGNLIELKIIPHRVEIIHPALIFPRPIDIEDMWKKVQKGEKIYIPPEPEPEPEYVPTAIEALLAGPAPASAAPTGAAPAGAAPADAPPSGTADGGGEEPKTEPSPEGEPQEVKPKAKKLRPKPQKYVPPVEVLTEEQILALQRKEEVTAAVMVLQNHERARQARVYFFELYSRHLIKLSIPPGAKQPPDPDPEIVNAAATKVQCFWRGYVAKQLIKQREIKRRFLIGMYEPSWKSYEEHEKLLRTEEARRALRDQYVRDYIQANIDERDRVFAVIGPGLMEDISDEIREWFYYWYVSVRNFDKYPPEEKGGSVLVVRAETMTPKEWIDEVERKRREKEKNKGKGGADKKKEAEKKKKAEAEKKKKEAEKKKKAAEAAKKKKKRAEDFEFQFGDSIADQNMKDAKKEYREIWDKPERDDALNPEQKLYMDIITDQKCYEMQLELRLVVDDMMRIELDLLNDAALRDKGKKGKKKKGKGKGKKGRKGKKGKKKKDPTGNRPTEDLFQELVDNGIIHTYPVVHLNQYKGDFSYCNWEKRALDFDPPGTLGDVRQAVLMNCILPLGVEKMVKPKSVLIAGHRQSGKHLLANAVFTETQCVLFDLSPSVLAGKYPGKKGMKMLVHLINKMSRLLQPSVIYIDRAETSFYKKVPKPEKALEPKRIGKQLLKGIVKPILPEDRVLLLSVTGQPWAAQAKGLKKTYERVILIPRTDYGSIYLYWRELLMPYHALDRNFDVSSITRPTVTYPLPQLKQAVETVLVPSRLIQLRYKPLQAAELLEAIIQGPEPVIDKEWKKFMKWYDKSKLGKERKAYNVLAEVKRAQEAKAAEKQKKKK